MNKKLVGVVGLASVALVGGTFAYFTQTATIDNPFNTAKYGTVVTEDFNPDDGDKWQPGAEVNKDLYVQNTGDRSVVVRVKFEDYWWRAAEGETNPRLVTVADNATGHNTFKEVLVSGDPTAIFNVKQGDGSDTAKSDGETEPDQTVVQKFFADGTVGGTWSTLQPDGYYYYLTPIAPQGSTGDSTGKFLEKVKLDKDVDMGHFQTTLYCKKGTKGVEPEVTDDMSGWTVMDMIDAPVSSVTAYSLDQLNAKIKEGNPDAETVTLGTNESLFTRASVKAQEGKAGYSDARYTLRITVETVQATDAAVKATWVKDKTTEEILNTFINNNWSQAAGLWTTEAITQ